MPTEKKIKSALISVYDKKDLDLIIRKLHDKGVKLYATGGTQDFIEGLKIPVIPVEQITEFPSILGGRVKTLHPRIFGGILNRRENQQDLAEMDEFHIPNIDLVVIDLYPFEETVASGASDADVIEKIDVGGISLIRAGAKNFNDVLIIPSKNEYDFLLKILDEKNGISTIDDRKMMAATAFHVTSDYDSLIFDFFNRETKLPFFKKSIAKSKKLRYGENPHQGGTFFGNLSDYFDQLNGKEISYNNLLDIDAAVSLMSEFTEPTIAIIKHNNACGLASSNNISDAWQKALAGDPVSAFGGVIISNRPVDSSIANEIDKIFFEVLIAQEFDKEALSILSKKKNRILLKQKKKELQSKQFRTVLNGFVEQDSDTHTENIADMKVVTIRKPTNMQFEDMEFANKIVKHLKSNAIVIAKQKQMLGCGCGQTSRVDALQHAIGKAKHFGFDLNGAVMASDAFFPFPDCVEIANHAGIDSVIQPGGSIKDQESIDYCNTRNMAMVTTGYRHFKH